MATSKALFQTKAPNILIAVDGSSYSDRAAQSGIELAKKLDATVILLCAVDISGLVGNAAVGGSMDSEILKAYEGESKEVVNDLAKKYPYAKKITQEGIPAEVILSTAKKNKVDVIVMGTHGRKGLSHLFMGSVAEYVVRHSTTPILVIPSDKKKK